MVPDAFDALGLQARFDLARTEIERGYLERITGAHPDAAPDPEAAARAALLNDAREALLDPERRAAVLLARLGGPGAGEDRSLPPDFLAEMMDVRERVESARAGSDPGETARWRDWADQRRDALIDEVSRAFGGLPSPAPAGALAAVRRTLNAWRYIERMREQLEEPAR